jgi:hypothetical protein
MRCGRWKNAFAKRKRRRNAEFAKKNRELRKSRGDQDARWQPRDFCLYLRPTSESRTGETLTGKPHGDIFANYTLGGEVACSSRAERRRGFVKWRAAARSTWRDVRVLEFAKAWICICSAELCSARNEGRDRPDRLRWGNAGVCRGADADGAAGTECDSGENSIWLAARRGGF